MRLDEKAKESLEAVERLLATSSPGAPGEPLSNAAASRAYYAAYQAVADCALRGGLEFDSSARDDLSWLRDLRVKADYWEDQVHYEEAAEAANIAARILATVLEGAGS